MPLSPLMIKLIFSALVGREVVNYLERSRESTGQRGLAKEQLAFQREKSKGEIGAGTEALKMQQAMSGKMWERLSTAKAEERGEARIERFETGQQASSDRQLAMLLAAIQSMSSGVSGMSPSAAPTSIVDILRR